MRSAVSGSASSAPLSSAGNSERAALASAGSPVSGAPGGVDAPELERRVAPAAGARARGPRRSSVALATRWRSARPPAARACRAAMPAGSLERRVGRARARVEVTGQPERAGPATGRSAALVRRARPRPLRRAARRRPGARRRRARGRARARTAASPARSGGGSAAHGAGTPPRSRALRGRSARSAAARSVATVAGSPAGSACSRCSATRLRVGALARRAAAAARRVPERALTRVGRLAVERARDQRMREREPIAVAGEQPDGAQPRRPAVARGRRVEPGELGGVPQRRRAAEHGERAGQRGGAVGQPGELALDAAGDLLGPERAQPRGDLVGRRDAARRPAGRAGRRAGTGCRR